MAEHGEAAIHVQKKLVKNVNALVNAVEEKKVANPYLEQHGDLVNIVTGEIMDPLIAQSLRNMKELGDSQAAEFIQNVLESGTKAFTDTIPRNNFYTFQNRPAAKPTKKRKQSVIKNSTALVTRYYFAVKERPDSDVENFFNYECVSEPPSLSKDGNLYFGTKSKLVDCLPNVPPRGTKNPGKKDATVIILDMAVVIHLVKPGNKTNTFGDYVQMNLRTYILNLITPDVTEIHAIWDSYTKGNKSTKASTRAKRGSTYQRKMKVEAQLKCPKGNISYNSLL